MYKHAAPDLERVKITLTYKGKYESEDTYIEGYNLLVLLRAAGADTGMIVRILEKRTTEKDDAKLRASAVGVF